ncbi:MAG TPA: hypothetical protein VMH20_14010 [Verrucomicrobiae bacterium]|nr:hypothetical protein [Verrucomicrobiae bacterium]
MQQPLFSESSSPDETGGLDREKALVLLLGNVDHEGITHSLKAGGEQYKKKLLASSAYNWRTIIALFELFTIRAVVIKLNADVYRLLLTPAYGTVREELLKKVTASRHIVFVYEDLLSGRTDSSPENINVKREQEYKNILERLDDEDRESYRTVLEKEQLPAQFLEEVNAFLRTYKLNLVPYRRNADVTVIATEFLKDALEQLLFRIYVPQGRLWANEIDRLLQLFRDYLLKTGRKGIRLDQVRTDSGVSYEFHSDELSPSPSLASDFYDFSQFLDLCLSLPSEAEALLREKNVDPKEIAEILARYSKEARRLQIDLKQDRERKLLGIRHRLESELAETLPASTCWEEIDALIAAALPLPSAIGLAHLLEGEPRGMPKIHMVRPSSININQQIIGTVQGVVANEILGNVTLSSEDKELLKFIKEHGGEQSIELSSAVYLLSDESVPKATRLASGQKLKAFLWAIGKKIGDIAANVLQSYIERKLGFH